MENVNPKRKLGSKEWFAVKLSLLALILSVVALLGVLGSAWIFYQQKELPQLFSGLFPKSSEAMSGSLSTVADGQDSNQNSDIRDRLAVMQAQIEQLNSALAHSAVNPLDMAKVNLHCALAELALGGHLDSAIRFIYEARDELVLAHRTAEVNLLDRALSNLSVAPSKSGVDKQTLGSLGKLESTVQELSFVMPVDPKDFKTVPSTSPNPIAGESAWKSAWEESWARVQSLVIIRNDQTVGENLITDSARQATVADVLLNLKTAEIALMTGQWVMFSNALNLASARVTVSFQENSQRDAWLSLLEIVQNYPPVAQEKLARMSVERVLDSLAGAQS